MSTAKTTTAALVTLAATLAACSGDPAQAPTLQIDVFGWDPGAQGFVSGAPPVQDAQTVRVSLTQPLDGIVVEAQTFASGERKGSIPEVTFGENLRMEFELLDGAGDTVAVGATPLFDFDEELSRKTYRLQVNHADAFAPVGSVVVDRESGERKFAWTRLDYRATDDQINWLGRLGHGTAKLDDGRVLLVGGGDPVPGATPGTFPDFRTVYRDVQVFDPATGYFTDLAYDESAGVRREEGEDRLFEPLVFPTVTPIGNDRFLIAGGFTPRSDVLRPVNTLQLIDMTAPEGSRVQRLVDGDGSSLVLQKARGWHTATFRPIDNHVVIAGGIGPQGSDDVLDTFEMVDLATMSVYGETFPMQAARAQHTALLMPDNKTVWIIGGHDATTVHASTEVLQVGSGGTTESQAEATMRTPRFGHGVSRMSPGGGQLILVAGGFTDLAGATTGAFEVSKLGRGSFEGGSDWELTSPRGGVTAIELPHTNDIVIIGGYDSNGAAVATAERLKFAALTASPPYSVQATAASLTPRFGASVDLLNSGRVLLIGGEGKIDNNTAALDSADYFNPLDPVGGFVTVVE